VRVLLTNNTLDAPEGTELYVRDVALALQARGHHPVAYSTVIGSVAEQLRAHGVPVVEDLASAALPPDVIHGHHHLETMTALLHFPGVPAISFCHGCVPWEEEPTLFPRVRRYVAVSEACRDRLLFQHGVPPERIRVLLNFVDLERFRRRPPLPPRPCRALVFNNCATEDNLIGAVRAACGRRRIAVDAAGLSCGAALDRPEEHLGNYDLVFACGRCALEALAVGAAVVLCKPLGVGPLVTHAEVERLRAQNLGQRALSAPVNEAALLCQIDRYNASDAAAVTDLIRATAGCAQAVDSLISLYREVVQEAAAAPPTQSGEELRAAAAYLRRLSPQLKRALGEGNMPPSADSASSQEIAAENGSRPPLPTSVKVLGGIYLLAGGLPLIETIWAAFQGTFYVGIAMLAVPLGVGLLRRSPAWRKLALCAAVVQILVLGLVVYILYGHSEEFADMWAGLSAKIGPMFGKLVLGALAALTAAGLAVSVWSIRLLTRNEVKRLFQPDVNSNRSSGLFPAIVLVLLLGMIMRETGGFSLNYFTMSQQGTSIRIRDVDAKDNNLALLGFEAPCLIEVRGTGEEWYRVVTTFTVRRDGGETSTDWESKSYSGLATSRLSPSLRDSKDRIIVEIDRPQLSGSYWLPLSKHFTVEYRARIRGEGKYVPFQDDVKEKRDVTVSGLCSVYHVKQIFLVQTENEAFAKIMNSAGQLPGTRKEERRETLNSAPR
jgi:hypothetical protein